VFEKIEGMKNRLLFLLLLFVSTFSFASKIERYQIQMPALLLAAKQLDNTGVVMQQRNHYTYLKISNAYIDSLYPILRSQLPRLFHHCLHKNTNRVGAHVSLFMAKYDKPAIYAKIKKLVGRRFQFTVTGATVVFIQRAYHHHSRVETWYVLSISSPELLSALKKIDPTDPYFNLLHVSIAVSKSEQGRCYY